jgi:hypothetical protein
MSMSDINPGQAVYATDEVSQKGRCKGRDSGQGGWRSRMGSLVGDGRASLRLGGISTSFQQPFRPL